MFKLFQHTFTSSCNEIFRCFRPMFPLKATIKSMIQYKVHTHTHLLVGIAELLKHEDFGTERATEDRKVS